MKHSIRRLPMLWRSTRLMRRWYYARWDAYPDWSGVLSREGARWSEALERAKAGPRVLLASSIGSYAHAVTLESATSSTNFCHRSRSMLSEITKSTSAAFPASANAASTGSVRPSGQPNDSR